MIKYYNTNSWHYRLATVYGLLPSYYEDSNICEYSKHVLFGIMTAGTVSVGSAIILAAVGAPFMWLWVSLEYGFIFELNGAPLLGTILWSMVIGTGICFGLIKLWLMAPVYNTEKLFSPITKILTDNFIVHTYQSITKKMCFKIEFIEDK